ncbi:hypothetical protein PENSTE_c001G06229 [Penicillium steckii]|uniref:Thioredoxin domain-containing protein n=1 Tax=Penicillium steckii TaxID=303698 RepID=A0A1V6U187_9EURO|nr:hypothetical protein PENSTE_c001G06229 [Penicillium steckii]
MRPFKTSPLRLPRLPIYRASTPSVLRSSIPTRLHVQTPIRSFTSTPIPHFSQSTHKMAGGKVVEITSKAEWDEKVVASKEPVLVDFFATWCGPCKAISPQIEKLSLAHENVKFFQVDVDKVGDVAADNGISAMPTFLFFKNGEKVETVRGANPPGIQAGLAKLLE